MVIKTENKGGFLYPVGASHKQHYHKKVKGKYTVAYKLHVTLSESTYKRDRAIVASFLVKHNHSFKMQPLRGIKGDEDRAFTIYPTSETDLLDVVAGIIGLHNHYNLTPGKPSADGPIVPGTSNLVTYHVERVSGHLLKDMEKAKAFSDRSKRALFKNGKLNPEKVEHIIKERKGYLAGGAYGSVRVDAMKFLMGAGPLDFLWSEGSSGSGRPLPPAPVLSEEQKKRNEKAREEKRWRISMGPEISIGASLELLRDDSFIPVWWDV